MPGYAPGLELDDESAGRIRATFASASENEDAFASALVERLWILWPGIFCLSRQDPTIHVTGVLRTLRRALAGLPKVEPARDVLVQLAERHRADGFVSCDFHMFREALLLTMETRLGSRFTASDRSAWRNACAIVAGPLLAAGSTATARETSRA